MSLLASVASGVRWSSMSQIGQQVMYLITTIVLARLLNAADFGLISMATVVTGFAILFKDMGTSAAIIQRKDISDEFVSSIFWVNIIFGFVVTIMLFVISPIVSGFYYEPKVKPLLQLLSAAFFLSSLSNIQHAIMVRDMAFNKLAVIEIASTLVGSIVGIGSALMEYGAWSLVYQTLATTVVTTVLLWKSASWRPKAILNWAEVMSVRNYSLNLTGFNIFNYFIRNTDNLLIGRFLGAQELGFYTLAYRIMLYPLQSVSSVIGRVMFPVYSRLQDDNARFRTAYLKVAGTIAFITFPLMMGLWVLSEPFILAVFGEQWRPVILLLTILAPLGMSQSIGTTVGVIYQAKGRTDWMFRWGILAGILLMTAFVIGLQWGTAGVAMAYAICSWSLIYPNYAIPFRLIDLRVRDLMIGLCRPLLSSLAMVFILLIAKTVFIGLSPKSALGICIPIGIFTYMIIGWFVNRMQMQELLDIIRVKV